MSDEERSKDAGLERLEGLRAELFRHFGKLTRFEALCVERDARTVEEKIRLAEEVLAAPSTGTVAEWQGYHLRLQGKKTFNVDEFLAGRTVGDRPSAADVEDLEPGDNNPSKDGP